jgi:hypothetical protein
MRLRSGHVSSSCSDRAGSSSGSRQQRRYAPCVRHENGKSYTHTRLGSCSVAHFFCFSRCIEGHRFLPRVVACSTSYAGGRGRATFLIFRRSYVKRCLRGRQSGTFVGFVGTPPLYFLHFLVFFYGYRVGGYLQNLQKVMQVDRCYLWVDEVLDRTPPTRLHSHFPKPAQFR